MDQDTRDTYWNASSGPEEEPTGKQYYTPQHPEDFNEVAQATEPTRPLQASTSTAELHNAATPASTAVMPVSTAEPPANTVTLPASTTATPASTTVTPAFEAPINVQESAFKPAVETPPVEVPPAGTSARAAAKQKQSKRAAKNVTGGTQKKSGGGFKTFALGFLGAALAFALGAGATGVFGNTYGRDTGVTSTIIGAQEATTVEAVNEAENLAEAVAEKALPSVVAIDTYVSSSTLGGFWGYGAQDSGSDGSMTAYGLGSGVVISEDGYILTNYHVIEGADKVVVTIEGQEYEGTVAGTDASSDLAVIKVESEESFPAIEIGDSSALKPGQWVMTLGSPFGLEQSVATGIISAVSRTVVMGSSDYSYGGQSETTNIYANMIQTDAAINPGNSGGALVNQNGQLVGINSVIESYSGSYSGVGFAIPVNYAINIAQQIIDGKTPTHAQIGVATTSVDASIAERYALSADKGAYVSKVYANSGAAEAGIEPGDIITKVDNTTIASSTDLVAAARAHTPGDQIEITLVRNGETQTVTVTLGSDENTELATGTSNGWQGQNEGNGFGNGDGQSNDWDIEDLLEYFGYGQGNGYGNGYEYDDYDYGYNEGYGQGQGQNDGQSNGTTMEDILEYFGYGQDNRDSKPQEGNEAA